ncbi:MAG: glycoside hydrolase family 31 protein [Edaphobacter sp.]|uniref:TIM-barrel domain-containing protein n=1 Tax=Edaphobacter sp. TaxID=1934404 RepID=UPI0023A2F0EA|nr:TIM-barrel domain-containing protein [Edaphobacter sp.]MDE1178478.1 glycoside hydrolase family 31 protein [Edaphobacter sp.]
MNISTRFTGLFSALLLSSSVALSAAAQDLSLRASDIQFHAQDSAFRYGFTVDDKPAVSADAAAGILIGGKPITLTGTPHCAASPCTLNATAADGTPLHIVITLAAHHATLTLSSAKVLGDVRFSTAGAAPAYGLSDHAVEQAHLSTLANKQFNTDVTGFADDAFLSGQGGTRLVSNFIIYPQQRFAVLLIDPHRKIVHTSAQQIQQGVQNLNGSVTIHYFFGDPHEIYKQYLDARNSAGYKVLMPKYEAFGVGWEAFGALGWETNQKTDTDSIDRYLKLGYPLKWIVIGSGFWPDKPDSMHATTSFGLWDHDKYPDPKGMIAHFKSEDLTVMLGLRIAFITDGPYSAAGLAHGYFLKDNDGKPLVYKIGFPHSPIYLLDAHNPAALSWYMSLVKKWQDYGVSGWKEDLYGYGKYDLRDDKIDPTNDRLMAQHQLIIERNGYLSSNGDLHRINDFNYNQNQDRGPVNSLALAYSGFPLVYPDIVGGTFGESRFSTGRTAKMETYMQRNAMWAAMHSSMGMGEPPWSFSASTAAVMLKAAKLHERIAPYLFSNARRFFNDGYPWTMTPLPIAFPDDASVYGRENATTRGYEWLIGDSMLATPLYGNDYDTSNARDIYLPAGNWMDFDTGKIYPGKQTLKSFALPTDKTPLFIGGSGVTLEQQQGKLYLCIYPVATTSTAKLTLPASATPITVNISSKVGAALSSLIVKTKSGKTVATTTLGHAIAFQPTAGETYNVSQNVTGN